VTGVEAQDSLRQAMGLLAALASGAEEGLGESSRHVSYAAGKRLGMRFSASARNTQELTEALSELRRVLSEAHCLWNFEVFRPKKYEVQSTGEGEQVLLVFRDCMIRQSLALFGHEQKGSLCNLMFGFFAGALEQIMGSQAVLEIVHAGENACLKRLIVKRRVDEAVVRTT
jgi:predicted hydrocarbon binding protein